MEPEAHPGGPGVFDPGCDVIGSGHKVIDGACLVPVEGAGGGPLMPGARGGVIGADGGPVPSAALMRHYPPLRYRLDGQPPTPDKPEKKPFTMLRPPHQPANPVHLQGEAIFGGYLFDHYGHFILESLSRLWFIKHYPSLPIVWIVADGDARLKPWQQDILALLGVRNPVHIAAAATEVERLIVPDDGFMIQTRFTQQQRDCLAVWPAAEPIVGQKIWVSRSKLSAGRYLNDRLLETYLERAGWTVYHPQDHALADQLKTFASAQRIAGVAGSALHTLIFLRGLRARVDIFARGRLLSQNFTTIARACGLDQHCHYIPGFLWSDDLPGWQANYLWLNIEPVLDRLGAADILPVAADLSDYAPHMSHEGPSLLIAGRGPYYFEDDKDLIQLVTDPDGRLRDRTNPVFHMGVSEAVRSGLIMDRLFKRVLVTPDCDMTQQDFGLLATILSEHAVIILPRQLVSRARPVWPQAREDALKIGGQAFVKLYLIPGG